MTEMEVLLEAEEYGERVEFRAAVPAEAFDSFPGPWPMPPAGRDR
ncbi:MAG: DUF1949 domain-containing protein [Gemmatimonadetes bacterium]|nr:DUF1949 domain-containing protein [Gemmatimonadota bacterium]